MNDTINKELTYSNYTFDDIKIVFRSYSRGIDTVYPFYEGRPDKEISPSDLVELIASLIADAISLRDEINLIRKLLSEYENNSDLESSKTCTLLENALNHLLILQKKFKVSAEIDCEGREGDYRVSFNDSYDLVDFSNSSHENYEGLQELHEFLFDEPFDLKLYFS